MAGINNLGMPSWELTRQAIHITAKKEVVGDKHLGKSLVNAAKMSQAENRLTKICNPNTIDEQQRMSVVTARKSLVEDAHGLLERGSVTINQEDRAKFNRLYLDWKAQQPKPDETPQTTHEEQAVRQFAASHPEAREELEQGEQLPPELKQQMTIGRIQDSLDRAEATMTENLGQAMERGEELSVLEERAEEIQHSAGLFQRESEEIRKMLEDSEILNLTKGMLFADAQADLIKANGEKQKAELLLGREDVALKPELAVPAAKDLIQAGEAIEDAQAKLTENREIPTKELFHILARDDIESVIRELKFEAMQSLIGLVMERLPKAHEGNKDDILKVANLFSSEDFWASLKSNMFLAEAQVAPGGTVSEKRLNEIEETITLQKATLAALIAEARTRAQNQ
jgi:hypothetical protein